jgi:hypothetical protein
MRNSLLILLSLFLFTSVTFSQLTHDTGPLKAATLSRAYIGHDEVAAGSGVVFNNSADAMFTAGIMYGTAATGVRGSVGSFTTSLQVVIINDMVNTTPLSGFTTNPFFNQITSQVAKDQNAPAPINLDVTMKSMSNTGDNFVIYVFDFNNNTGAAVNQFYAGIFSDWDVGAAAYASNRGGYDEPRKLIYQYGTTSADQKYYGLVSLTAYAGSNVTAEFPGTEATMRDILFTWMTTSNVTTINTNADYRSYIGSGPFNIAAGGTASAAFAVVVGTDLANLQANADAAQLKYNNHVLPVELTSFAASADNGTVTLNWATATEINNRGFEVEKSIDNADFRVIGFVNGFGTTTETRNYSFSESGLTEGKYYYRLRQLDFNGDYEYSPVAEVTVVTVFDFALDQNYPNPFNPSTKIFYSVAEAGHVKLSVYNLLGQEVASLVNSFMESGKYEINFNAADLPSGAYIYKIETAQFSQARKMLLTK